MSDDPARGLAALYPSSASKPDATSGTGTPKAAAASPATSPGNVAPKASTGATKPAATSPASASPGNAAQSNKGTWQAPSAAPPGTAAQPETKAPAEPASLYVEPIKTMEEAVAATPIPESDAANFDQGEEGRQARTEIRSAFISAGASKEETAELWGLALAAARPDFQPETFETAEAALRREWKGEFQTRLDRARNYMREVARRHPAIVPEIKALGLDVNAKFVAAVEKAARRRGR